MVDACRFLRFVVMALAACALTSCSKPIPFHIADAQSSEPLEGVRIYRHSVSIFSLLPSKRPPVASDFAGVAIVNIPPNPTNLTFLRQGYEPASIGVFRQMPAAMTAAAAHGTASDPSAAWNKLLIWDDLMPKVEVPVAMRSLTSGAVEVFVLDEAGAPIRNCEVLGATFLYLPMPGAEPEWGFPALQRVTTDDSGRAMMRSWSGLRNRYTARAAGHDEVHADVDGALDVSLELRLPVLQWRTQRFRVVDMKGKPVEGAALSYGEIRDGIPAGPHAFLVTTDREGNTPEVRLPNADAMLIKVSARGYDDRMTAPLWRALEEGGTWRVVMERK